MAGAVRKLIEYEKATTRLWSRAATARLIDGGVRSRHPLDSLPGARQLSRLRAPGGLQVPPLRGAGTGALIPRLDEPADAGQV